PTRSSSMTRADGSCRSRCAGSWACSESPTFCGCVRCSGPRSEHGDAVSDRFGEPSGQARDEVDAPAGPLPAFVIRGIETLDGDACGETGDPLWVHLTHPFGKCSVGWIQPRAKEAA